MLGERENSKSFTTLMERLAVTPAHITRLFRGSDPLWAKAMTRLAHAGDGTVKVDIKASV